MNKLFSPLFIALLSLMATVQADALSLGDVTVVGYNSSGTDSVAFVSWADIPNSEQITISDAIYTGSGTGEGPGGGNYTQRNSNLVWTNDTGAAIAAGTVIAVSTDTASIGSAVGDLRLTTGGEQFFLIQGSFHASGYLDGTLLFGVDYDASSGSGWDGGTESALPGVLSASNEYLFFNGATSREFTGARSGKELSAYRADVLNANNWGDLVTSGVLSSTVFTDDAPSEVLGAVSPGLIFHPRRMNSNQAILDESWSLAQGATGDNIENLNGACCIRIPSWIGVNDRADPTAVYYLYFADHSGNYIRMAWAANIEGPWTGFRMNETTYPSIGHRGVLSLGADDEIDAGDGVYLDGHIASPDILIDDTNQRIIMYFHGQVSIGSVGTNRQQRTIAATSSDGLNFNMPSGGDSRAGQSGHGVLPVNYGESYFRIFEEGGRQYALTNTGDLYGAPVDASNVPLDPLVPDASYDHSSRYWDKGPNSFTDETEGRGWTDWGGGFGALRPRHFGVLKRDGMLYAFFTNKGEIEERIKISTYDFANLPAGQELSFESWKGAFPNQELIRPEENWEGGNLALSISGAGGSDDPVRELRDPSIFEDSDGRTYLFYSGKGEKAIGLAQIVSLPVVGGPTEVTTGADHTFTVTTDVDVTPEMLKISRAAPVEVDYDAEEATLPFTYAGNGYNPVQSGTVAQGSSSYQLAHSSTNQSATLTFPDRYYAAPGATLQFSSRLRSATDGQFAEVQISFDGSTWQTIWIQRGGSPDGSFSTQTVDISGMVGRTFEMRFRYQHEPLRNSSIVSGNSSSQGWFIDEVVVTGLEAVTVASDSAFTSSSFTLDDIASIIDSASVVGDNLDDRFLLSVSGLHSGTGFSESIDYGKPYVIRVRTSYEQFMYDNFTEAERADPLISGKTADPDKDGIVNLLEHTFGTNAGTPNGSQLSISTNSGIHTLTFPWNPDAGHRYYLQMGDLISPFADIAFTESTEVIEGVLMVSLTPHPSVTVSSQQAYFRIRVE